MLDFVMPPRCIMCGEVVADPGALCSSCFEEVTFITPPFCARCGIPFVDAVLDAQENTICGACIQNAPAFGRARAVFVYNEKSRSLVTRYKYADRTDFTPALGKWLTRAGTEVLDDADLILPVPLHRWRLFFRTYNQSALLARRVSGLSNVPAAYDVLRRKKRTPSQGGLSAKARRRNVARAFEVVDAQAVSNKRIVIVDDVLTTGATLDSCARVLRDAGAENVDALVIGRVPAPGG